MSDINHEFRTLDNRGEATRFEYPIETVRGEQGEPGQAATITVGTTTTGEAGTDASVENVGNTTDAVLNFTIPKGDKGEPGQAATITVGTTTTGEAGTDASVENVGDTTDAVLNFTIPKGDKGEVGASPTVGDVVAHSASPESEPAVQIDDENHVLNFTFTIPQGVKGDTGATGAPGLPAVMEAVAEEGDEAHAEVELKDPDTNTYTLKLTLPKGEKGDTPEIPEVVIDSVQWVDTPEEASITPTYDKDHNVLNVAFKLPHWKGEKGENGVSITFGGVYETLDEAPGQPELNTLITVGVEHHQDLYIYDGAQWQKLGSIAGEKGEQGIQGKAGQSVKFIGYFNGVEDIVTKVPQPELNNMAVVTKEEGARYLALYTGNDWVDLAKISGDKGEAGEKGAPGEPGEPGKPAIIDEVTAIAGDEAGAQLTRLSEEDNTYSILFTVPAGKDGKDGEDGKDGKDGKDGSDIQLNVEETMIPYTPKNYSRFKSVFESNENGSKTLKLNHPIFPTSRAHLLTVQGSYEGNTPQFDVGFGADNLVKVEDNKGTLSDGIFEITAYLENGYFISAVPLSNESTLDYDGGFEINSNPSNFKVEIPTDDSQKLKISVTRLTSLQEGEGAIKNVSFLGYVIIESSEGSEL